ncbi:MAG TPA: hypothetical protein VGM29_07080, partial [Polyangiaceae bacterium]
MTCFTKWRALARRTPRLCAFALGLALSFASRSARAQVVVAEPVAPVLVPFPENAPPLEVQVVLSLVVDEGGHVESAIV